MTRPSAALVEARGLGFAYDETPVFDGIDLSVAPGEMVGLLGPNGSGKTTLLKLLCGTLRPERGEVLLDGAPLRELTARRRARAIGVVPQETSLVFDFTVLETVLMGRTPYLGLLGVEGPEDVAAAEMALRTTGTLRHAGRLLSHLSGGERQLAVIARALAQRPRLLLLDEPTAHLDVRHRLQIYALLRRLNAEEGLTVLTTSHDLNLAARFCRRVVLLQGGRVRSDGPPLQVLDPTVLSQVYETPLGVVIDPESGAPVVTPRVPMTPAT